MKFLHKKSLTLFTLLLLTINSFASHVAGGDISYVYVGNGRYVVCLNLFVDCNPNSAAAPPTGDISIESSCGGTISLSLPLENPGGTEVSQLCAADIPFSTCNGGTLPGMRRWTYCDTVQMDTTCDYTIKWDLCCRNQLIVNQPAPTSVGLYLEATLNHSATGNLPNNSASFFADPIPYVCSGFPINYSYQVIEPDGDSLVFTMIDPESTENVTIPFDTFNGYSLTEPFGTPGTILNSTDRKSVV